jgi:hypothetical protein
MIESWEDLAKVLLRKRSSEAQRDFRSSVRPMYRNSDANPRPEHIGSCILLNVDGLPILSTAAHILDNLTEGYSLYVGGPGGTHPVLIRGGVLGATPKPNGSRRRDHFDCGFWSIPGEVVPELGAVEFLDASRLSDNSADVDRRYYMAMGYRLAANKSTIDHRAKTIGNRLSRYSGSVVQIPNLAEKLGVSGAEHMFLTFPKYAQDEDDRRVTAFGPVGFSGGPLLDLGDFTVVEAYAPGSSYRATLSGMMIEQYPQFQAMVGVKIGFMVDEIRQRLRRFTSPVRFGTLKRGPDRDPS